MELRMKSLEAEIEAMRALEARPKTPFPPILPSKPCLKKANTLVIWGFSAVSLVPNWYLETPAAIRDEEFLT